MDRFRYFLGVVTLALAVAGGWYLVELLQDEDKSRYFRLNVEFRDVGGLLPGADVKYRGVLVGSVRHVTLREDGKKGIATIVLEPSREGLARTNSHFWIVTPRFGGITGGASGLDTLVRDAYLSFYTPDPFGVQLANGSSVAGDEQPFADATDLSFAPAKRGDLQLVLLLPENHGLQPGSAVMYRGVQTGEVRRIELAADGGHVRLHVRIERDQRATVTDKTKFWVARPRLSGALLRGIDVHDIGALLAPFVSYFTEPGAGLPLSDGSVLAAETQRPELTLDKIPVERVATNQDEPPAETGIRLARVIYEAVEEDWWSPDDEIRREGTGVLYEDREGRVLVATTRTVSDASYFERDAFGADPEIKKEGISIQLTDGTVLRAMRTWVAPDGEDLTLLMLDLEGADKAAVPLTAAGRLQFTDDWQGVDSVQLYSIDDDRVVSKAPADPSALADDAATRGAAAVVGERVVALRGNESGQSGAGRMVSLSLVPEGLRPTP